MRCGREVLRPGGDSLGHRARGGPDDHGPGDGPTWVAECGARAGRGKSTPRSGRTDAGLGNAVRRVRPLARAYGRESTIMLGRVPSLAGGFFAALGSSGMADRVCAGEDEEWSSRVLVPTGAPPRPRGREGPGHLLVSGGRSTPDVRGDDGESAGGGTRGSGAPPARGRHALEQPVDHRGRSTPARAGTTPALSTLETLTAEHPRVRGTTARARGRRDGG